MFVDFEYKYRDHNYQARMYSDQKLEPIETLNNEVPKAFPINYNHLIALQSEFRLILMISFDIEKCTARQLDRLFAAFGLPLNGDLNQKRKKFRRFVGIVRNI